MVFDEIRRAMGIYEMQLPPGFTPDDVWDADLDAEEEEAVSEAIEDIEDITDADIRDFSDEQMQALMNAAIAWQNLDNKEKASVNKQIADAVENKQPIPDHLVAFSWVNKGNRASKLIRIFHPSNFRDAPKKRGGQLITLDEFKEKLKIRPEKLLKQNQKMKSSGALEGKTFYDISLPAYRGLFLDEKSNKMKMVMTCPAAGECKYWCYACFGNYISKTLPSMRAAQIVNYLMNDPRGFAKQLVEEIEALGDKAIIRWHDAGDFMSPKYLDLAFEVARETPDVLHYAYTKQFPMFREKRKQMPKNFDIVFSIGSIYDKGEQAVNRKKEKHSVMVPLGDDEKEGYSLFGGAIKVPGKRAKKIQIDPSKIDDFKKWISSTYKVPLLSVVTYGELVAKPIGKKREWNVLVWGEDGDDAAARRDVLGIFLLQH